ncbi:hypothetical protein GOODEAATRI_028558, partial [Goodea atripinnis]
CLIKQMQQVVCSLSTTQDSGLQQRFSLSTLRRTVTGHLFNIGLFSFYNKDVGIR